MDRIRQKLTDTLFPFADQRVTFSGGISSWQLADTPQEMIKRVESLITLSKQSGRNRLFSDQDLLTSARSDRPTDGQT